MQFNHPSIRDSLDKLREVASAMPRPNCDWETRPEFLPPPTRAELQITMSSLALALPDDISEYLALCGGIRGMSVHNGYHLCGASDIAKVNSQATAYLPKVLPTIGGTEPVLTIGFDGGGNAWLLSPRSGNVWRWDHETGKTTRIAESFGHFLQRVAEDWTAYIHGRPHWSYLV